METNGGNQDFSREELLKELKEIEAHEAKLVSRNYEDEEPYLHDIPLAIEKNKFFGTEDERKRNTPAKQVRGFAFVSLALTLSLLAAFFVYKGFAAKGLGMDKSIAAYEQFAFAGENFKRFDFSGAEKGFLAAYENLESAEESISGVGDLTLSIAQSIPFSSKTESGISLLRAAKHMAKAGEVISSAFSSSPLGAISADSFLGMLAGNGGQSVYTKGELDVFAQKLRIGEGELEAAQKEMRSVNSGDFPAEFRSSIQDLNDEIPTLLNITRILGDYSEVSSFLLGLDSPKRYLIVFQNSSELRPTGGFIGSYAVVDVEKGALKNILVDGIYNADGRLTVNVVPPTPFQHITTAWSTHDANWFLDFPTSAKKIAWFYERTGGGEVDGVFTLNVEVIERLLALSGPVILEDYDLVLDSENFRDEIQYEVEVAYDKELNRPKQVLSDFTPIFLQGLFEEAGNIDKEFASLMVEMLEQKYIMFYSQDTKVQEFFEEQGWSGQIANDKLQKTNDYLAVAHSNIGGYKTDKYMDDAIRYSIEISQDGSLVANLAVERMHNGGDSRYWWYNRANIDYVKVYAPAGAEIVSYSGAKRRDPAKPADYAALGFDVDLDILSAESGGEKHGPVDIFEESGKKVFGTWLVTNPKSKSVFELKYKLPFGIDFKNGVGKYELYLQKQPGTRSGATVAISPPPNWQTVWNSFKDTGGEHSVLLDTDKVIGYIFKK